MSTLVRQRAQTAAVRGIAAEQSEVVVSLLYYLREDGWPILSLPRGELAANQSGLDWPLTTEPLLYLSDHSSPQRLAENYSTVETLAPIDAVTGLHSTRRLFAFKLSGVRAKASQATAAAR